MLKKLALTLGGLLAAAILAISIFVVTYTPGQRATTGLRIEATPERLERGAYLVNHVLVCLDCHSEKDQTRFGGPVVGPLGAGGECWTPALGFPGTVCAPNLTADAGTGLGNWTDDEILRAIREGVHRSGRGLAPVMPYDIYRNLSDEDAHAAVAYLRSLPAVEKSYAEPSIDFPVSFFFKLAPRPLEGPVSGPGTTTGVEYGRYLATVSGCRFCHTPLDDQHQSIAGMEFAGGHAFPTPVGTVVAPNLTPHSSGVLPKSEATFLKLFRDNGNQAERAIPIMDGRTTVMPWYFYAGMSDADLQAIYAFLETVEPIANSVEKYPASSAHVR